MPRFTRNDIYCMTFAQLVDRLEYDRIMMEIYNYKSKLRSYHINNMELITEAIYDRQARGELITLYKNKWISNHDLIEKLTQLNHNLIEEMKNILSDRKENWFILLTTARNEYAINKQNIDNLKGLHEVAA